MEHLSEVVQIAGYNIGYGASKSSAKRVLGPTVLWPGDKFCPTPNATSC